MKSLIVSPSSVVSENIEPLSLKLKMKSLNGNPKASKVSILTKNEIVEPSIKPDVFKRDVKSSHFELSESLKRHLVS